MNDHQTPEQMREMFEMVANYFSLLAEPMRLRILHALCMGELPVADIVTRVESTQTNVSRHLNILYRARVLSRRKDGTQVYYAVYDQKTKQLCQSVCSEISMQMDARPMLIGRQQAPG
jgi:DNA-binding transcriptional ArsR family regulator